MSNYEAVGIAEGFIECDDEERMIEAWQHLITTGLCWRLQGSFGRQAATLIREGVRVLETTRGEDGKVC